MDFDPLTSFLWDPISCGVQYCKLAFDKSGLTEFVRAVWDKIPAEARPRIGEEEFEIGSSSLGGIHRTLPLSELVDFPTESLGTVTQVLRRILEDRHLLSQDLLDHVAPAVSWLAFVNNLPTFDAATILKKPDKESRSSRRTGVGVSFTTSLALRRLVRSGQGLFDANLPLVPSQDAIHLASHKHNKIFIIESTSVKGEGLHRFLEFLRGVPEINKSLRIIKQEPHHSSRLVFDPYPAAVSAWIRGQSATENIPGYVLDYLQAAFEYYDDREWRTSVVLSAIALETLLAEMFENEFHKQAPDVPLGALKKRIEKTFQKARKSQAFPDEILDWIDKTNAARIAAVHRGGRELSMRETLEAHRGLVKVALWYYRVRQEESAPITGRTLASASPEIDIPLGKE